MIIAAAVVVSVLLAAPAVFQVARRPAARAQLSGDRAGLTGGATASSSASRTTLYSG